MQISIASTRYGALGEALGKLSNRLQRLLGRAKYDTLRVEHVSGLSLVVLPTVFNPRLLRTGAYFAEQLRNTGVCQDRKVLDMGTGSGICGVMAAQAAREVIAVDLNPAAVRCATINALLNRVDEKMAARQGDLFAPVRGERFDLVLFNPPFIRGEPKDPRDYAWRSVDAVERFASELPRYLTPDGFALILLSTFGDAPDFVAEFSRRDFDVSIYAQRDYVNETISIIKVVPRHVSQSHEERT